MSGDLDHEEKETDNSDNFLRSACACIRLVTFDKIRALLLLVYSSRDDSLSRNKRNERQVYSSQTESEAHEEYT